MPFSEKEAERLVKSLSERLSKNNGGLRSCVLCGDTDWSLSTIPSAVVGSKVFRNISIRQERTDFTPVALLSCGNCGNTHLIKMDVIGVYPDKQEDTGGLS